MWLYQRECSPTPATHESFCSTRPSASASPHTVYRGVPCRFSFPLSNSHLRCPLNVHSGHESENHALVVPICPSSTMTSVGSQIALHFLSNRLHPLCTRLRTTAPRTISPSKTALSTCN